MSVRTSLLSLTVAALASTALASTATAAPTVKVHAIFGGQGVHVGQVLDVQTSGHTSSKVQQICWDPAPIGRPACSLGDGAPSATGTTKLTLRLADGSELHKTLKVSPAFTHRGGRGGSNAAPGHVACRGLTLWGNVPSKTTKKPHDKMTTLAADAQVAQYNRIGDYVFYWEYATNKAGFGRVGCVTDGLGS
jgi:hypothetical protein